MKRKLKIIAIVIVVIIAGHFAAYTKAKKEYNRTYEKIELANNDSIELSYSVKRTPPFYLIGEGYLTYEIRTNDITQKGKLLPSRYDLPIDVDLVVTKISDDSLLVKCLKGNKVGWLFKKEASGRYSVTDLRASID